MDCSVVVEAAVQVYDVGTRDEAVRIAISKTGDQLNPDLNYVEISPGTRRCSECGDRLRPAFVAADEALVDLDLEMDVFNVEREEHARRIARKEIGQRLPEVPLAVETVEVIDGDGGSPEATGDAVDVSSEVSPDGAGSPPESPAPERGAEGDPRRDGTR
ncbi:MAG: DUF555 domain-containing protein [Halobacteriaceae archaeon]